MVILLVSFVCFFLLVLFVYDTPRTITVYLDLKYVRDGFISAMVPGIWQFVVCDIFSSLFWTEMILQNIMYCA